MPLSFNIVDVPAFRVNPVPEKLKVPLDEIELVLNESVVAFCDVQDMFPSVKLYEARSKDPFVTIKLDVPIFNALPSVQPQPTPLTVIAEANVTPLVVSVLPVLELDSVISPV